MAGASGALADRLARAQALMAAEGIDLLVIGPSSDFRYFTGHEPGLSERLTALVIPRTGQSEIVAPRLEAPLLDDLRDRFTFHVWGDTENPVNRIAGLAADTGSDTIAVNDQLWSGFLLQLQALQPKAHYRRGAAVLKRLRVVKDSEELAILREASRRTDKVWEEFCATTTLTGQTERQLADRLTQLMFAHGMETVEFCIVASGPNGAVPHHATGDRVIQARDPVVIDVGGRYQGYFSDLTRTPVAGEPDPEIAAVYRIVLDAQQAAFEAIKPGTPCQEVDRVARRIISERGFGDAFIHRLGHGIGLTGHEDPYLVEGNDELLQAGMVMSDEPGIYLAGRWGVRIEDTVAVTSDGAERFNHVSRELTSLP